MHEETDPGDQDLYEPFWNPMTEIPDFSIASLSRRSVVAGMGALLFPARAGAQASEANWLPVAQQPKTSVSFNDRRGRKVDLSKFKGTPIILNVWASWCAPCLVELPGLDRLQQSLRRKLLIVPVSVDRTGMEAVELVYRKLRIRHLPAYVDSQSALSMALPLPAMPSTWLVNSAGNFIAVRRGPIRWDASEERRTMQRMLQIA